MGSTPVIWKQYNKMAVLQFFLVKNPYNVYSILFGFISNPNFAKVSVKGNNISIFKTTKNILAKKAKYTLHMMVNNLLFFDRTFLSLNLSVI